MSILWQVDVSEGNVAEVAEFLANQTSESSEDARNLKAVATILKSIVGVEFGDIEV